MSTVFVQFSDSTETKVIAYFSGPQDDAVWPNQGQIDATDPRYLAFISPPEAAFTAAIAAGCQVQSASTPAVNGTYAISDSDQQKITSEQLYIATTGKFTTGTTERQWKLLNGTLVTFSSTAVATEVFEAIGQYVNALEVALFAVQGGGSWAAPAKPVTIP